MKGMLKKGGSVAVVIIVAIIYFQMNDHGKKIDYNGSDIFYTENVTEPEARALGDYFKEAGWFKSGSEKSIKLEKEDGRYQVKFVVSESNSDDKKTVTLFKDIGKEISKDIFQGKPVDVFFCNEIFRTRKEIRMN